MFVYPLSTLRSAYISRPVMSAKTARQSERCSWMNRRLKLIVVMLMCTVTYRSHHHVCAQVAYNKGEKVSPETAEEVQSSASSGAPHVDPRSPAPKDDYATWLAEEEELDQDRSELDVVVVTGSKMEENLSDAVTQVEVITRAQIESTPAENAADLLEEQHGVQVTRSFRGAGVRLQGFDNKHVLILIDGERQIGRIDGVIDLTRIPTDLIEQVEIVKGPSSSLYGSDAMGGVINIITRRDDAQEPRFALRGLYGSRSTIDVNGDASAHLGSWSSRLLLSFNRQDAYDWAPSDIATSGSAYDRFSANYKTSLRLSTKAKVDGRAEYTYIDLQGIDSTSPKLVFDRRNLRETALVSIKPSVTFNPRSSLNGFISHQIFRDQFVLDQRGSTTRDRDEETQEGLSQAGISYNNTLGYHIINVGGEVLHQRLTADRLSQEESSRWRGALYVQDEWLLLTDLPLSVVSGLRVDADSQFGQFTSPKLALRFDPHPALITRLSYGMGYRAPVFKELYLFFENPSVGYVVEGNPDLKPETSQSLNLGLEASLFPLVRLTLNGFYHHVDQLIAANLGETDETGTRRYRYANIDEVRHRGIEVGASLLLPLNLGLGIGYMLTSSRDLRQNRQLTGRALHQGTAELKYHNKALSTLASVSVMWSASRPFYADLDGDTVEETLRADPYATVDLRFKQGIGENLNFFINIENLLNEGDHQFLPIQPFTTSGGLSLHTH